MVVVRGVEVEVGSLARGEDYGDVQPMSETCLVVDTPSYRCFRSMSEVRHHETRLADLRYDLVINLAGEVMPVNAERVVSRFFNSGFDGLLVDLVHAGVKPHSNERLRRIGVGAQLCDAGVTLGS